MQTKLTNTQDSSQAFKYHSLGGVGFEGVDVLVGLGLSMRQARVYLALVRSGVVGVQVVSDLSGVHRQEVYRVLDMLQQIGLVQKNITNPATFSVTPINQAVKVLLDQKIRKLDDVAKKAEQLTRKLGQTVDSSSFELTIKPCFGTIVEADRGKHYQRSIRKAHQTIEAVVSWKRFRQLSVHFDTQLLNAMKRNVIVHVITEKPDRQPLPKWVNTGISRYPNFEFKTIKELPKAAVTIFDHTQASIAYSLNTSLTKGPDLWTNNPAVTALTQAYFNTVWAQTS